MKKPLRNFILIVILLIGLAFFLWPSLGSDAREYFLAKVLGSEFCPKGQGGDFDDEILVYVNKEISLPSNYIPKSLVLIPKEVKTTNAICVKSEVVPYLKDMFDDALTQNINLAVTSGFRSEETQAFLYNALFKLKGEKAKDRIAKPLHSEHQLGTTMDISGESIGYVSASNRFIDTLEALWLEQNAYKYGFVLSYQKDKTPITGYDYEPWHYRFVGLETAQKIFEQKITIEEYLISSEM